MSPAGLARLSLSLSLSPFISDTQTQRIIFTIPSLYNISYFITRYYHCHHHHSSHFYRLYISSLFIQPFPLVAFYILSVITMDKAKNLVRLGTSDLWVTPICLGTMTWGIQNTKEEAFAQLDYAIKQRNINFLDTAELYPVPTTSPLWRPGNTELILGEYLSKHDAEFRRSLIVATKVAGYTPDSPIPAFRRDPHLAELPEKKQVCNLDYVSVKEACAASLRRLRTDYIDLYQIHWPSRYVPGFGTTVYDASKERTDTVPIKETLMALKELIDEGKIRYYGLSNETTFGVCEWVKCADELGAPRPITIQNPFSLLGRRFETELAEACAPSNYNIGLLPWSVLCGGALSGKYLDNQRPEKSRFTLFSLFQHRFVNPRTVEPLLQYKKIADDLGISLASLALAWCKSRTFIPSTIIGATTMQQLKENIDAFDIELTPETLKAIDDVHVLHPNPTETI